MTPLTWDDEFRHLTEAELKASGVADWLEPVVWKYTPDVSTDLVAEMWEKYASVFPAIWLASAFKGATGSNKYITNISKWISPAFKLFKWLGFLLHLH